ncbi:MAG: preprotein translocase subunit YajC [Chitinophagales bacterium]|jgi:preprotein translocase subunit YajC|nr:preprotein translocase subunit YajC [Chitinophagales bacterium]
MSTASGTSGSPGYMNLIFLLALFAVMYFFMIRPQTKKAKDQKNFLDTLQKGDKIITVAGIHGRITRINENGTLEVEIDTNTKVMMERSGISMEYTRAIQNQQQPQK